MTWGAIGAAAVGTVGGALLSSGSGNSPTQTTGGTQSQSNYGQSTYAPNPAVAPLYGFLSGNTGQLMQTPQGFFPGPTYVGPSGPTQQAVDMAMAGLPYFQQGAGATAGAAPIYQMAGLTGLGASLGMGGVNQTALGNYGFLSNAADVASNPYVQGMLAQNAQSATDWLQNTALPSIQQGAVAANAMGSDRMGLAQGTAAAEAQKNLLAQNAQTQMAAYQQGLGAQQTALGQTGGLLANMMAPAQAQAWAAQQQGLAGGALGQAGQMMGQGAQQGLAAGQTVEEYQRRALQDAMDRYNFQYTQPWANMQNVQGILQSLYPLGVQTNGSMAQGANTSTAPNPYYQDPMQAMLGGALTGYGVYDTYRTSQGGQVAQG